MIDRQHLATALKRRREADGISLNKVAALIGVGRHVVWSVEHEAHEPTAENLARILRWLGQPASRVVGDAEPVIASDGRPIPETVRLILGRDNKLSWTNRFALYDIFSAAYAHYVKAANLERLNERP